MFLPGGGPLPLGQPAIGLFRMSPSEHSPELSKDIRVDIAKRTCSHHMFVVVGPTPKDFVELFYQYHNWRALVLAGQCSNLTHEG